MKWSFANVGILIFGFFGIIIVTFFNELTVSNEQDYYTLKEAVEASMIEAVDVTYFRLTGSIKINQEKFVENLTRRFSEVAVFGEGNYNLEFYQISESPPKVSVRVVDATNSYNIFGTFGTDPTQINIVNEVTAIMDVYKDDEIVGNKPIDTFSAGDIQLVDVEDETYPGDKIFKYENQYYRMDEDDELPASGNDCELYNNRIECKDDDENVIVLEQILGVTNQDTCMVLVDAGIGDPSEKFLESVAHEKFFNEWIPLNYPNKFENCYIIESYLADYSAWRVVAECYKKGCS